MLLRSFGFTPVIWLIQMRSPSPSGYCGASSSMRHSGRTYAAASRSVATSTISRERRSMRSIVGHLRLRPARRHPDVTLHLLVQRRAEVGAVEGEDAGPFGQPQDRARLAGHHEQLGVVCAGYRKAMRHVPVLLQVGDVEVHRVAYLDALDVVGHEVAADGRHVHMDDLALPDDLGLLLALHRERIPVLRQ